MPALSFPHVAALVAVTEQAKAALGGRPEVPITKFPFNVGREDRLNAFAKLQSAIERRIGGLPPENDLYLLEPDPKSLQISRAHFAIHLANGRYRLEDRGSSCGTFVAGRHLSRQSHELSSTINPSDLIVVGSTHSPYVFRFELRAAEPAKA